MLKDMSYAQKIALAISILGFVAGGGTQLTDILSPLGSIAPIIVKELVSISGFVSGILGIVLANVTGQASQIKAVEAMPGVEKVLVNAKANPTLATIAVAEDHPKVEATPEATKAVEATAKTA